MAKRFLKPSINWMELEKRVPVEQKNNFFAFKGKSEAYLERVLANPAEMPKIDWETYKKLIPIPGLVDKFKSEMDKYGIPYPQDTMTTKIEEQWKSIQKEIQSFCAEQDKEIETASKELKRMQALPKYEDMTMEMFYDIYPNDALDPVKRPTFWPHDSEEQPDYKPPEQKAIEKKDGH